ATAKEGQRTTKESEVKTRYTCVECDHQGNAVTNFHLPKSKSALNGEDVNWARQVGPSDPHTAFKNHLEINLPPHNRLLFAYCNGKSHKALTKSKFLSVLASALKMSGRPPMQGHNICIGSTLKYLLRNIPFDIVKVKGRWTSYAFLVYLHCHTQILSPYIHA
ncbi:hypothetical protein PAXRUDRAFT_99168, partial [Paxillus rubicundulus Ve08.2h10]